MKTIMNKRNPIINNMKTFQLLITVLFTTAILFVNAQEGVAINPTGANPDPSAMLDITNSSKGLLLPRVALNATNIATPVTAPATSLVVYNTATAGSGITAVTPGFYYWDGTQWVRLLSGNGIVGTDDQNLDSLVLNNLILTAYIEDGTSASTNLQAVVDSSFSYTILNADQFFTNTTFINNFDSLLLANGDTLL
jgi:hypothetical protein